MRPGNPPPHPDPLLPSGEERGNGRCRLRPLSALQGGEGQGEVGDVWGRRDPVRSDIALRRHAPEATRRGGMEGWRSWTRGISCPPGAPPLPRSQEADERSGRCREESSIWRFRARKGCPSRAWQTLRSRTHPAAPPYPRNLFTDRKRVPFWHYEQNRACDAIESPGRACGGGSAPACAAAQIHGLPVPVPPQLMAEIPLGSGGPWAQRPRLS